MELSFKFHPSPILNQNIIIYTRNRRRENQMLKNTMIIPFFLKIGKSSTKVWEKNCSIYVGTL